MVARSMYFRDPLFLRCVLLLLLALGWSSNASAVDVGTSEPYREQRLETWGTSLAWWGDYIGGWTNQQAKSDVLKLIFDSPNHLGLNSLRYNIGGGQNQNGSLIGTRRRYHRTAQGHAGQQSLASVPLPTLHPPRFRQQVDPLVDSKRVRVSALPVLSSKPDGFECFAKILDVAHAQLGQARGRRTMGPEDSRRFGEDCDEGIRSAQVFTHAAIGKESVEGTRVDKVAGKEIAAGLIE